MEQVPESIVQELELRVEFGRQSSVAIVDQGGSLTEACQFALENIDAMTECVSFRDKALNCVRGVEE